MNDKESLERMQIIQKLFTQILNYAAELEEIRKQLLGTLHRFVFENARPLAFEKKVAR
jgi:hypothetical protein